MSQQEELYKKRNEVLSTIIAKVAEGRLPEVRSFRENVLSNTRLHESDIDLWATSTSPETLEQLAELCSRLAAQLDWDEEDARLFVLTGKEPRHEDIRVRYAAGAVPACDRIVLEIDPAVPGNRLAAEYKKLRRRTRQLSSKRMALAYFVRKHRQLSWADRMAAWNRLDVHHYESIAMFKRDAITAYERLMYPLYKPRGSVVLADLEGSDD